MKSVIAILALATAAQAFNTQYEKAVLGETTFIKNYKNNASDRIVSILVDVNTQDGQFPKVIEDRASKLVCGHKQTLIAYSGYDMKTRTFIRKYEVQIQLKGNRSTPCVVSIATQEAKSLDEAARIIIL